MTRVLTMAALVGPMIDKGMDDKDILESLERYSGVQDPAASPSAIAEEHEPCCHVLWPRSEIRIHFSHDADRRSHLQPSTTHASTTLLWTSRPTKRTIPPPLRCE